MDPVALLDTVEYTLRAQRHLIDACWNDHTMTTGHKRKLLSDDDISPCAACLGLAASAQQNDQVLGNFLNERRRHAEAGMKLNKGELAEIGVG